MWYVLNEYEKYYHIHQNDEIVSLKLVDKILSQIEFKNFNLI